MVGQIDGSGFISDGIVFDAKGVIIGEGKSNPKAHIAWVAFFAISTGAGKANASVVSGNNTFSGPIFTIKTFFATMKAVWAIVSSEGIFFAIEREFGITNAVANSAYGATEIRMFGKEAFEGIEAHDDICHLSFVIRNFNGLNGSAEGDEPNFHALAVLQGENINSLALLGFSEGGSDNIIRCRTES